MFAMSEGQADYQIAAYPVNTVHANGLDFAYLELGQGPLLLCLHGFPDTAYTFLSQLEYFAAQGFHVVAPFMRGYAPSQVAPDGDYQIPTLGRDVIALIEAFGQQQAYVIGHDWGALAAYAAAKIAPHRVAKLVAAAVPHPLGLKLSLAQLRRSWYIFFFQLRGIAERRLMHNDFALINQLVKAWSPSWVVSESMLLPIKRILSSPAGRQAALGYYRDIFTLLHARHRQAAVEVVLAKTSVPTLAVAGREDGCFGLENFRAMDSAFSGAYQLSIIDQAGHFMHREQTDEFNQSVAGFLLG